MPTLLERFSAAPLNTRRTPLDLRTFDLLGLRLPLRATVVITVMVFAVILDFSRTFIPDELIAYDRNPGDAAAPVVRSAGALRRSFHCSSSSSGSATGPARYGLRTRRLAMGRRR